jgi:hypothetical protein
MSDFDQTIMSNPGAGGVPGSPVPDNDPKPDETKKRNPLLIIGGIGCLVLLCAVLVIGGGIYMARDQLEELTGIGGAGEAGTETVTPDAAEPEAEVELEPAEGEVVENTATPVDDTTPEQEEDTGAGNDAETPTPTAAVDLEPQIGAITFALDATEDYEPIDPGTEFDSEVTEIHAIFDYSGFSPEFTWERVWYLDGAENAKQCRSVVRG